MAGSDSSAPGASPYPREYAFHAAIEDFNPTIPQLKEMKLSDFIDIVLMK